jgi:hypothetical protein
MRAWYGSETNGTRLTNKLPLREASDGRFIGRPHFYHLSRHGYALGKKMKEKINNFITLAADETNHMLFRAGAKAGSQAVIALADDIHHTCKAMKQSKAGMAEPLLMILFPRLGESLQRSQEEISRVEEIVARMRTQRNLASLQDDDEIEED